MGPQPSELPDVHTHHAHSPPWVELTHWATLSSCRTAGLPPTHAEEKATCSPARRRLYREEGAALWVTFKLTHYSLHWSHTEQ